MDYTVPDTLVLKIEEYERDDSHLIDTTLYILYDSRSDRYVIRGNRRSTKSLVSQPYSFEAESSRDLAEFIEFVICSENRVSYSLYNYDNLHLNSEYITYDFLESWDDKEYELVGYDNQKLERNKLLKILRILRGVFNYY